MTNYEWLLQMGGEERQAWFDAEHAEGIIVNNYVTEKPSNIRKGLGYKDRPPHEKSEECKRFERELDAELDEIDDSREKLEEDVRKWCGMYPYQADMVWAWLNRQAAITEREAFMRGRASLDDEFAECADEIAELTAERDALTAECDALADDLRDCNRERESLRRALGVAIDHAHDILQLVDEGMA